MKNIMKKCKKIILPLMFLIIAIILAVCFFYFRKIEEEKAIKNKAYMEAMQDFANRRQQDKEWKIKMREEDLEQKSVISEGLYEPAGHGLYWFVIKEMGIKLKIKKELKNSRLVYYYRVSVNEETGHIVESVSFSNKELEILGQDCLAGKGPLGALIKIEGTFEDNKNMENFDYVVAREPRQMDGFMIYFINNPDSLCNGGWKREVVESKKQQSENQEEIDRQSELTLSTAVKYMETIE